MQPLSGIKVLDASRLLAGPFCGMLLGDLGADVVKIEPPAPGDGTHAWPPFLGGESCYFLSVNRNKRGMVLNLASREGQEVFRTMARSADVVLENFRSDVMAGWGLDYDSLKAENPGLIYCGISAFGATGPDRLKAATDIAMQAFSGIMSITGEPGRPPVRIGVSLTDLTAAVFAALGIVAALQARQQTGRGQMLDISLLEGQMAFLSFMLTSYLATGKVPGPLGQQHPSVAPYQIFRASDGWLSVAVFNDRLWQRCARAMGRPELADDPLFATNPQRVERKDELAALLGAQFETRTMQEWVEIMDAAGVPVAPVNTLETLVAHPQVKARQAVMAITHPRAGTFKTFGFPIQLSDTPCTVRHHPPIPGEHTAEVLGEYGFDLAAIDQLRARGVFG